MSTLVVSIGRNIGDGPDRLSDEAWRTFVLKTDAALASLYDESALVFAGRGVGVYDGKDEEAATWILSGVDVTDELTRRLSALAEEFVQDSIAVTYGETIFVERTTA